MCKIINMFNDSSTSPLGTYVYVSSKPDPVDAILPVVKKAGATK